MALPLLLQVSSALGTDRDLIGGKAASLIELEQQGAAVPPAFVITTEAYRCWVREGGTDAQLTQLLREGIVELQKRTGRSFGAGADGLIVSVRSGAPVSMPGMMDTVLNVGIGRMGPDTPGFLRDARARFLWQYAETVLALDASRLADIRLEFPQVVDSQHINALEDRLAREATGKAKDWPRTAHEELLGAAKAVFESWESSRARLYRRMRRIEDCLGTTVTVQQMVFGNRDSSSGSGVAFTRNPTSGERGLHGEFVRGGQGEEVVAGRETGRGLDDWRGTQPAQWVELEALGKRLEGRYGKVMEIEFTVEQGRLYLLQCRPALLTVRAAVRIAVEMAGEGLFDRHTALRYAEAHGFDLAADPTGLVVRPGELAISSGLPVGGGLGVGRVAFSTKKADELMRSGEPVVFVAVETSPQLLSIMQRAAALVTMRGGASSHAAVVARSLGTPCVVGVGAPIVNGRIAIGAGVSEGDLLTVDGDGGALYVGDVTTRASRRNHFEATLHEWAADLPQRAYTEGSPT